MNLLDKMKSRLFALSSCVNKFEMGYESVNKVCAHLNMPGRFFFQSREVCRNLLWQGMVPADEHEHNYKIQARIPSSDYVDSIVQGREPWNVKPNGVNQMFRFEIVIEAANFGELHNCSGEFPLGKSYFVNSATMRHMLPDLCQIIANQERSYSGIVLRPPFTAGLCVGTCDNMDTKQVVFSETEERMSNDTCDDLLMFSETFGETTAVTRDAALLVASLLGLHAAQSHASHFQTGCSQFRDEVFLAIKRDVSHVERQSLRSITRAILADPEILVVDRAIDQLPEVVYRRALSVLRLWQHADGLPGLLDLEREIGYTKMIEGLNILSLSTRCDIEALFPMNRIGSTKAHGRQRFDSGAASTLPGWISSRSWGQIRRTLLVHTQFHMVSTKHEVQSGSGTANETDVIEKACWHEAHYFAVPACIFDSALLLEQEIDGDLEANFAPMAVFRKNAARTLSFQPAKLSSQVSNKLTARLSVAQMEMDSGANKEFTAIVNSASVDTPRFTHSFRKSFQLEDAGGGREDDLESVTVSVPDPSVPDERIRIEAGLAVNRSQKVNLLAEVQL
eukprot:gnl/TRDRNA2_/TRDRNA2_173555_c2_seq2.p1 gnl/TRDRNA2_/TRDRNA2_173555_c2~~gnl/TRDRNA2_/TRDRNA2_173555_c2_seq2.p1  ORF type:complete len:564 (-),score=72.28 gnl/TRDRNA2_/TRDRNA2_173555_c2_seq2:63-1754(-)